MSSEFATVHPATPLSAIKRHIISGNQRFLPVVEGKAIAGAITRTDLLRALHVDTDTDGGDTVRQTASKKTTMKTLLSERLPRPVLQLLKNAGKTAEELGYSAYAVGGFVRDILLRVENYDIDIVIEGDGIKFARKFAAQHDYTVKVYRKFGTAVIQIGAGRKIDIASSRLEYYEKPAALPKVEWSSIKLDLYRRDFTMNTLAVRLSPHCFGELIDFFGARRDIKEKTIRVLHNLSFVEDPSRIYRAVRFEQRFDFHISKLTKNLIQNAIKMDFLKSLSGKRIFSELVLLLGEERVAAVIKRLHELKLLKYIHPSLLYDTTLRNLLKNIGDVLSWFDLLYLDNTHEKWFVYLLGLFDRLKIDDIEALCRYFDIKKRYANALRTAKTTGNDILYSMARKKSIPHAEIYRLLHPVPVEVSLFLMAKANRQSTKKAFSLYFTQLHSLNIQVTGDDLIRLGIQPGHIYKKIFEAVLHEVLNGTISGKEAELKFIRQRFLKGAV
jgi:tRNA nucleotidyltransferase (CCA-adding enzyme)